MEPGLIVITKGRMVEVYNINVYSCWLLPLLCLPLLLHLPLHFFLSFSLSFPFHASSHQLQCRKKQKCLRYKLHILPSEHILMPLFHFVLFASWYECTMHHSPEEHECYWQRSRRFRKWYVLSMEYIPLWGMCVSNICPSRKTIQPQTYEVIIMTHILKTNYRYYYHNHGNKIYARETIIMLQNQA